MRDALYDRIGTRYASARHADPRIAAVITRALGGARRVVNVGAGAGSYEPTDAFVAAVDPSAVMLAQRPRHAGPAVLGVAAALPFPPGAFDAAMATLSVHHWPDWRAGIAEMRRVAARVVVFTFDPALEDALWLVRDYLPEMIGQRDFRMPPPGEIAAELHDGRVDVVAVPWDCTDGFTGAYWRRPEAYLDPAVRDGMSAISVMDRALVEARMARLRDDLTSGTWDRRHGHLRTLGALDLGYRVVSGLAREPSPAETATPA